MSLSSEWGAGVVGYQTRGVGKDKTPRLRELVEDTDNSSNQLREYQNIIKQGNAMIPNRGCRLESSGEFLKMMPR